MRFLLALLAALSLPAAAQPLEPWRGGAPPALELADPSGAVHRLADYRGKVLLVNFWATWCEPCREEMPSLERLEAAMRGRSFTVLGVSVGDGPRAVRLFARRLQIGFPLVLDGDTSVARAWNARILPATFILDRDGRIRYAHFGALDWDAAEVRAAIERLLR